MCHVGDEKGQNSDKVIDKVIKSLEEGESYKYLGVLEADEVMGNKERILQKQYIIGLPGVVFKPELKK